MASLKVAMATCFCGVRETGDADGLALNMGGQLSNYLHEVLEPLLHVASFQDDPFPPVTAGGTGLK